MAVEWNKVTWYSKLVAVILFVLTFYIGYKLGAKKTEVTLGTAPAQEEKTPVKTTPAVSMTSKDINEENFTGKISVLSGPSPLVSLSNNYIEQALTDFRDQANTDVPDIREKFGKDAPTSKYEIDISAKYVKSVKTESIAVTVYTFTGGAHGSSMYKVFTVDRSSGKILPLGSVVKASEQNAFTEFVKKKLLNWKIEGAQVVFPDSVKDITFSTFKNWSLDDKNLTIYFDQYEIGPGALGEVAFPISLTDIKSFLNAPY
jgi:hypothetical protein